MKPPRAVALLLVLLLAACDANEPANPPPTPKGSGEQGIGFVEASKRGVLVADFDAKFGEPTTSGGLITVPLINVGRHDDTYLITIEPSPAGAVMPATADVAAGDTVTITVRLTDQATVNVFSTGRDAEIANISLDGDVAERPSPHHRRAGQDRSDA
jgi:hypothetical protein